MADKESKAKVIVVAGMHRSGTSALSRTLNLVGCEIAKILVGGDNLGNERGHWESQGINELNSEILASAGSRWDDWEAINPSWYASPLYDKYFEQARALLRREYPSTPLFVIKDPRFCRLMDLWINVIESLEATPLVVMPVRNPHEVAASLLHRDDIDPSIGRLLWLRHVLDAEAGSRSCQRVTVCFEDLLNDWQGLVARIGEELQVSWPNMSSASSSEIEDFLTPELHHHADTRTKVESDVQSVRWIAESYDILQRWSAGEEHDSDLATLDEISSNLNALGPLFGRPILLGRSAMRDVRILEGKRDELANQLAAEASRIEELQGVVAEEKGTIESLRQSRTEQTEEFAKQRAEFTRLTVEQAAEIARQHAELTRQQAHIIEQDRTIDGQRSKSVALNDALANTRDQVGALLQAVNERERRIDALLRSSSWRLTAPLRQSRLALRWLLRKSLRLAQICGWLCTGQLRKAAHAALPFYRRHAPRWLGSLIPRRMRHWLRASTTPISPSALPHQGLDADDAPGRSLFVPEFRGEPPASSPVQLLAFYLPQFHPIPENDAWWGEGFTEWTNVRTATPQFAGHYQPRVPIDAGYYDLSDPDAQRRQVELAKRYGVGGFCFYFYWFAGRRLLETPLLNYLNDSAMDLPFCLCWANENWTRRWDGRDQDLLIGQEHSPEDDLQFIKYVSRYLSDSRYIRIDDRPLLLVYRPALFPSAKETVLRWRGWCRENGIGELYVAMVQSFQDLDPRPYGMDAAIEFPWHTGLPTDVTAHLVPSKSEFRGYVFDWEDYATKCEEQPDQPWTQMRGVMPGWDNTPRRNSEAHLFQGHSPASYGRWLSSAMRWTLAQKHSTSERLLFINAWNEWGEGAYLEPDQRFGYAFLQATRNAVDEVAQQPVDPVRPDPLTGAGLLSGAAALVSKQVAPVGPGYTASPAGICLQCPPQPDVSIVIPAFGKCHLTLRCLKSLNDLGDERSFEVILVDDASTDESADVLPSLVGLRYLRNDENQGFLESCNRGAALARGRYILLLNNDTLVENGTIDALAHTFDVHDNVGLVGAKLYFEDGSLQEAGGIVWSDGSAMNFGRGDDPRKPEYNYVRDTDYCSGAAIMLPTALWQQLGGFDSYYERAYYEDTDLAFRVRKAGHRVLYQPFAKVVHREGATSGTDPSKGEKRYQTENHSRFLERWRAVLESNHHAPGTPPQVAKDRAAAGHALIIDWATPMPDHDSGSVDIFNLVRMLGRLGIKTIFASHRDLHYCGTYTDNLQQLGVEMLHAPYCDSLESYLKRAGRDIDYVLVHRVGVFKAWASLLKAHCPNARIVFHTVDLHHIREARQAETENSEKLRKQAKITKKTELGLARKADAIVVVSDHEKKLLEEAVEGTPVFHMPLIR
ncbi:MAG: glycoside hydrolase family 99-like domain-containing protein, partial [Gammaproteobacteria bacterium]|nr:glycoside hydrolase family 99-like domain-containing protein [Gammaproteobacteria bacterium]